MIRKFYQSVNTIKYSIPMTVLAFIIFAEAYLTTMGKDISALRIALIVTAAALAVVMVFYYRSKFQVRRQLKKVEDLKAYEAGGMIDRSYFLEDRMLVCAGLHIEEVRTKDLVEAVLEEKAHGRFVLHLKDHTHTIDMSLLDREEGERTAGYLKRVNPAIVLTDVEPKGKGTLKELGADVRYEKK
jgi:Ca2+/Na+ antiporter